MEQPPTYDEEFLKSYEGTLTEETFDIIQFTHSYEKYISNRDYYYSTCEVGLENFCIKIRNNNLPHLMALSQNHHTNLPKYQAEKIFEHLKVDWDMDFIEASDSGFFKDFKIRILGVAFLYQIFRLIECQVRVPLPKAHRMKKMNIDFIISPNKSESVLYTVELRTDNQFENGVPIYFPQSLRFKDNKSLLETRPIEAQLERIVSASPQKKRKKKKKRKQPY